LVELNNCLTSSMRCHSHHSSAIHSLPSLTVQGNLFRIDLVGQQPSALSKLLRIDIEKRRDSDLHCYYIRFSDLQSRSGRSSRAPRLSLSSVPTSDIVFRYLQILIGYTFITVGPASASVFLPEKETNMKFETDMAKYYFENLSYLFTIV
jgi:hypothetical protein